MNYVNALLNHSHLCFFIYLKIFFSVFFLKVMLDETWM